MTTDESQSRAMRRAGAPISFYAANDTVHRTAGGGSNSFLLHAGSGIPIKVIDGQPLCVSRSTSRTMQLVVKRVMDILLSIVALVVLGPLFLFVALAIKLTSRGPVFFVQQREGLHGCSFGAFKFRTMRASECDMSGVKHTLKDDPRITPIGRFLRRTSIDELPQIINVLKGDMSLVGPRPHVAGMMAAGQRYDRLVPYYAMRHDMLPGITGWAQVNGLRGRVETAEQARARVDFDIAYIQNFSLMLDLRILMRTLLTEFITGSGD